MFVCWLVACLTSQQHASVSQGRSCTHNFTCCHTDIDVADPTFYLTQSQYTDTRPTSPSADPTMPGAWQGSHWSSNFEVTGVTRPGKNPVASWIRTPDLPLPRRTPLPLGQRGVERVETRRDSHYCHSMNAFILPRLVMNLVHHTPLLPNRCRRPTQPFKGCSRARFCTAVSVLRLVLCGSRLLKRHEEQSLA